MWDQSKLPGWARNQTRDLLEFSQSNTRFRRRRKIIIKAVSAILRTGVVGSDILLNCFIAGEVNYKSSCLSSVTQTYRYAEGRHPSPQSSARLFQFPPPPPFFRHIPRIRAYYPTTNRAKRSCANLVKRAAKQGVKGAL